jgi:HSP20 family protein
MTNSVEVKNTETTRAQAEATRTRPAVSPDVDIVERAQDLLVVADLPGVDEKGIEITLENNVLTFTGRSAVQAPAGYETAYAESEPVDYTRSFTISEDIDREKIAASIRHGVLRITLPKAPQAQPRRIAVQVQ